MQKIELLRNAKISLSKFMLLRTVCVIFCHVIFFLQIVFIVGVAEGLASRMQESTSGTKLLCSISNSLLKFKIFIASRSLFALLASFGHDSCNQNKKFLGKRILLILEYLKPYSLNLSRALSSMVATLL